MVLVGIIEEIFKTRIGLLVYLSISTISISYSFLIEEFRLRQELICAQDEIFSTTHDCGGFIICRKDEFPILKQCPPNQNFDAVQQMCLQKELVDCSQQILTRPSNELEHNRLKKRAIPHESLSVRHKRETLKSPTKPWGQWVNGDYVPYLVGLAAKSPQCVPANVIPQNVTTGIEQDEVEPEETEKFVVVHHYGPTMATYQKIPQVARGKEKVRFLSEDMDAGAKVEAGLSYLILGTGKPLVWTHSVPIK